MMSIDSPKKGKKKIMSLKHSYQNVTHKIWCTLVPFTIPLRLLLTGAIQHPLKLIFFMENANECPSGY